MTTIPLSQIEQMFREMKTNEGWDSTSELLWGYFFTDQSQIKLKRLEEHLISQGYKQVQIYQTDDQSTYVLHVEKREVYSPKTLFACNAEFERLATEYEIDTYDGMDVGPVTAET